MHNGQMTHNGQRPITIVHLESWAQVKIGGGGGGALCV